MSGVHAQKVAMRSGRLLVRNCRGTGRGETWMARGNIPGYSVWCARGGGPFGL